MPTLVSLQVGLPKRRAMPEGVRIDFRHPTWTSGIFKEPIPGPVLITAEGIPGDGQADPEFHGGPDNIVLAYDAAHYPHWRQTLGRPDLPFGAFGENFTVEGFSDETVCIGDIWQVGDTLTLQVTQPRQPCYKLARRLEFSGIVKLVREGRNGGWYLRVLTPGPAAPGMTITRTANPHPDWPVAKAVEIMYTRALNPALAQALAMLPEISERWRSELTEL
jgi:MOSC domain-containing protein YiiM